MHRHTRLAFASLAVMAAAAGTPALAQSPHIIAPPDQVIAVKAGHLFDSKLGEMLSNQVVLIKGDRITDVGANLRDSRRCQGNRSERRDGAARDDRHPRAREHRRHLRGTARPDRARATRRPISMPASPP